MAGQHTLAETERRVADRLDHVDIDFQALAIASNLFRSASLVRGHLERTFLSASGLSWAAFAVLWVTWVWEPVETRQIADEVGFSKATLTGVLKTLEGRGLILRVKSKEDGRLVMVSLTDKGINLMDDLFPKFNNHGQMISASIEGKNLTLFADMLSALSSCAEGR